MASADVSSISGHGAAFQHKPEFTTTATNTAANKQQGPHHVQTTLNYYKPNEDGSPPAPSYVGKPETYERPFERRSVIVTDVSGNEDKYTLDGTGFQIYNHASLEKDFLDDEKIKREYYPETEQLLKDA